MRTFPHLTPQDIDPVSDLHGCSSIILELGVWMDDHAGKKPVSERWTRYGAGIAIKDFHSREIIQRIGVYIPNTTYLRALHWGLREGLRLAHDAGVESVRIDTASKRLADHMGGTKAPHPNLYGDHQSARVFLAGGDWTVRKSRGSLDDAEWAATEALAKRKHTSTVSR